MHPKILSIAGFDGSGDAGCALSAALASCLALGIDHLEACRISKRYLQGALIASKNQDIGSGHGPVHHFYHLWPTLEKIKGE